MSYDPHDITIRSNIYIVKHIMSVEGEVASWSSMAKDVCEVTDRVPRCHRAHLLGEGVTLRDLIEMDGEVS